MNFFSKIEFNKRLAEKSSLGEVILLILSLIYLISSNFSQLKIQLPLMLLSIILALFFINKLNQILLWSIFLAIFISELVMKYFVKANHHFLLVYVILLIIFYHKNGRWEDFVANIKWIVVIVLMCSAIQKLISPQFVSGDFYYYMLNTGKFFRPMLYFTPEIKEIIFSNYSQIIELERTNPNLTNSITLQNILPNLDVISRVFAWLTIALEFIIAAVLFWKPKHTFSHILFIILILGIFFTRLESGFLTLLAICGFWLTESLKFRALYVILAIGFMVLIVTQIGFH